MNKLKKLLALLLCAAMTLGVMPALALAEEQAEPVKETAELGTVVVQETKQDEGNSERTESATPTVTVAEPEANAADEVTLMASGTYYPDIGVWFDAGSGTITDADESLSGTLTIPDNIDGAEVKSIGDYAFQNCSNLTGLVLPNTVTYLGQLILENSSVASIKIPKSVTECAWRPLANAPKLTKVEFEEGMTEIPRDILCCYDFESHIGNVTIPSTVTSIGNYAFENCDAITAVDIPKSVKSIGEAAFQSCDNLTQVTFHENNERGFELRIEERAFGGCSKLESLDLPSTLTYFGERFIENTAISSIKIPQSVVECGYRPLANAPLLTNIELEEGMTSIPRDIFCCYDYESHIGNIAIPSTVTSIGNYSFENCDAITAVDIPAGVKSIGECAFLSCDNLAQVTFHNNSAREFSLEIQVKAFADCPNLTKLELPSTVTYLGERFIQNTSIYNITVPKSVTGCGAYYGGPFADCETLQNIYLEDGMTVIPNALLEGVINLTEINIPKTVELIGDYAFNGCTNLSKVTLNYNDAREFECHIGDYVFQDCVNLKELVIPESVTYLGEHMIKGTSIESITVPKSVKENGAYYGGPFAGCETLTNIILEDGIEIIPNYFFESTNHIESIMIPSSVQSLGDGAFKSCASLKSITIPDTVTTIGDEAFFECFSLKDVKLSKELTKIGANAFKNCELLEKIEIPKSLTETDYNGGSGGSPTEGVFAGCNLKEISFEQGITLIAGDLFAGCNHLESVTIPETVRQINTGAFQYCTNLTSVTLPSDLEEIGPYVFRRCENLGLINIPNSVQKIGDFAFSDCYELKEITLSENLKEIGEYAFNECDKLKMISIPAAITYIGKNAFQNCDILQHVRFNDSTDENHELLIDDYAFLNCTKISSLYLPEGLTELGHHFIEGTMISSITVPKTLKSVGAYYGGPFCGAIYLDDVYFEDGLTAIPNYMCESNSHNSYISRVEIPDTVTSIGYGAFGNCIKLKKLFIPDSVEYIDGDIFYGTNGLVVQCSEASPAIEHIIDNDMQFQLTHDITSYDHLVYKNTDYYSDINSMTGYVPLELNYEVKNDVDIYDKEIVIRIPSNSTLIESTLKVDGIIATNYEYEDNKLIVPVEENSGTIVFSVRPTEYDTLLTYAMMRFNENGENKTEVIGVLNCSIPDISIKTDTVTNSETVTVEGIAPPSGTVEFYVDNEYAGETTAIKSGNYKTAVTLPSLENYKRYTITAVTTKNGEEVEASTSIKYQEDVPTLKSLVMYYNEYGYGTHRYELTDDSNVTPTIVYYPNYGFKFEAEMDHPEQIEELYIVSTRSNQKKYMDAEWDEASGKFVAEGFFEGVNPSTYVPGEITVEYRKKAPNVEIKETLDDSELEVIRNNIDKSVLDSTVEVTTNTDDEFEASIYLPDELQELFGDEIKFAAKEIYKEYGDSDINDLMSVGKDIYSYFFEKDGSKYVFNYKLDDMDGQKINMILHDITGNKMVTWAVEAVDKTKFQSVSGFLEKFNSISGTIADAYEIESADEDLRDKIYASGMTPEQQAEALKKADELKKDRYGFMATSMIITALTASGIGAPALAFGLLFGAITTSSSFFWDLRMANILGTETGFSLKWSIDPSGYVYEAVDSNRVDGVTATAYWIAPEFIGEDGSFDESNAVLWDAAEYAQLNPLTTDMNGAYAWDVPEGLWQVKFEKDGYETFVTEWLPVPPPQTDVNVGIISKNAPTVAGAELYANSLTLTFDKYMRPETVENIAIDGVSGVTVTPVDAEAAPDGTVYARSYSIGFNESLIGGTVHTVSVADAVSYAGTEMIPYSQGLTVVKAEITDIAAKPYGDVVRVSVSAENVPAGAVVYLAAYGAGGSMLSLNNAKFVDGIAAADVPIEDVVRVKALLWSNVSDMIPLCEAKEVEVTQ